MNKMIRMTNICMLVLIAFSISEPYVQATQIIVDGTNEVLKSESEKGKIIFEKENVKNLSEKINVNQEFAYKIEANAQNLFINEKKFENSSSNVIVPTSNTLDINADNITNLKITQLSTKIDNQEFEVTNLEKLDFNYQPKKNVSVAIKVDNQTIDLKNGYNEITFANNQKLVLKIYDPVNIVSSYKELFTGIHSVSSSSDKEEDSTNTEEKNTQLDSKESSEEKSNNYNEKSGVESDNSGDKKSEDKSEKPSKGKSEDKSEKPNKEKIEGKSEQSSKEKSDSNPDNVDAQTGIAPDLRHYPPISLKIITENGDNIVEPGEDTVFEVVAHSNGKEWNYINVTNDVYGKTVKPAGDNLLDYFNIDMDQTIEFSPAEDQILTEDIPDEVTSLPGFPNGRTNDLKLSNFNGSYDDMMYWTGGILIRIPVGHDVTFRFHGTVKDSVAPGTIITNVACIQDNVLDHGFGKDGGCISAQTSPIGGGSYDDTIIKKEIHDEDMDGFAEPGEVLHYTVKVENPTKDDIKNVTVRDSLLENLPSWLTYNNDMTFSGGGSKLKQGSITDASDPLLFDKINKHDTLTITYSVTLGQNIPDDISKVYNNASDDGKHYDTCSISNSLDCAETEIPVYRKPSLDKKVEDENKNGLAESNEKLTYTVTFTNNMESGELMNVRIRDSLLENLPSWIIYNDDMKLEPNTSYTGSLVNGDFTIAEVEPKETITITYSITTKDIPSDVIEIKNIVTDTGNMVSVCKPNNDSCAETTTPVGPNTSIEKKVEDENNDGFASVGEVLKYQINVKNESKSLSVSDVKVRDSLLEAIPAWLTFNNDVKVDPSVATSGDLQSGDFVISEIKPGQTITITYSMTVNDLPLDQSEVANNATDPGDMVDV